MSSSQSRSKAVVAAAVGAGLIGAAGFLVYYGREYKRRQQSLEIHLVRISKAWNRSERMSGSSSSGEKRECYTAEKSENSSEDEFYDCFTDEEDMADRREEGEEMEINTRPKEREESLLKTVDDLLKGDDSDRLKAFRLLQKEEQMLSDDPNFLWRYAKAHQMQATAHGARKNNNAKEEFVLKGLDYASRALSLDPDNPDVNKWFAILSGMEAEFLSVKKKIEKAQVFYHHLSRAIAMRPEDYSLHHLLGRFKFELANVSWMERRLASMFFDDIPEFQYSDAVPHLEDAEKLSPTPWIENRLLLAKCYLGLKKEEEAAEWLYKASRVVSRTEEDKKLKEEVKSLLEKVYKN